MNEILAVVLVCLVSEIVTKDSFPSSEEDEDDDILTPK